MPYQKNISTPNRPARALPVVTAFPLLLAGALDKAILLPVGVLLLALTIVGLIGWCPFCALLGFGGDWH